MCQTYCHKCFGHENNNNNFFWALHFIKVKKEINNIFLIFIFRADFYKITLYNICFVAPLFHQVWVAGCQYFWS